MFRLIEGDPPAAQVQRITFVPFLPDGRCVLIEAPECPALPAGEVLAGEDYLIDTVLRVPLQTAGFRYQRFRPFGQDGPRLYAWIEGAPYRGERPHTRARLTYGTAEQAASRLRDHGQPVAAAAVTAAAASYRAQDEQAYYADSLRTLERSYLRGQTPQSGSGFGGDARAWRQGRHHITEAISASGTFLDTGCANGLLMESVAGWCGERGVAIEPYGIDLAPRLVELARQRLPRWADRIWPGNAIDWRPPGGLRFDYVHLLLDCVPRHRRGDLVRHHLAWTVRPGTGRLLVSHYGADEAAGEPTAAAVLTSLGFPCAGQTSGAKRPGRPTAPTAWIDAGAAGLGR
ncbi:MAG: class I SAM-dependent methyltransferase [Actinobacteria bacterium]|nr:class I SAM-dependent methyltransferase [Actinomycetota bacterium]MBO0817339.1 class I SAM-dependent methyltransferase [Actinomycetota bacterium]